MPTLIVDIMASLRSLHPTTLTICQALGQRDGRLAVREAAGQRDGRSPGGGPKRPWPWAAPCIMPLVRRPRIHIVIVVAQAGSRSPARPGRSVGDDCMNAYPSISCSLSSRDPPVASCVDSGRSQAPSRATEDAAGMAAFVPPALAAKWSAPFVLSSAHTTANPRADTGEGSQQRPDRTDGRWAPSHTATAERSVHAWIAPPGAR